MPFTVQAAAEIEVGLRLWSLFVPAKPVAENLGLLCLNCGLLCGIVGCHVGVLSFPGMCLCGAGMGAAAAVVVVVAAWEAYPSTLDLEGVALTPNAEQVRFMFLVLTLRGPQYL